MGWRGPLALLVVEHRRQCRERRDPEQAEALAARRVALFTPARPLPVAFGDAIRRLGYSLSRSTVRRGGRLGLVCCAALARSPATAAPGAVYRRGSPAR